MEQLNPHERAYLAGFRDGYRRAMSELRGESDELLERQRVRLEDWTERLRTKLDRLDAIENFNMTELRHKASELAYEKANEIVNEMWANLNTELKNLRAEVIRLRASGSGGETEQDPATQLN